MAKRLAMSRNELLKAIAVKLGGSGEAETENGLLQEIAQIGGAIDLTNVRNDLLNAYLKAIGG